MPPLSDLWVYLAALPLWWLAATLTAYLLAGWIYRRSGLAPWCNPVAIAVILLAIVLTLTDTSYHTYFSGAQFVHFLLGPATVALAVPLYTQRARVRASWLPLAGALLAGSTTAVLSAVGIARLLGASTATVLSMAPKSATSPIAMAVSERLGGLPSLTAALVIGTGIIGAVFGPWLLRYLRIRDAAAGGVAMGVAAHGVGTARAFQESEEMGAFSGLAMALNGAVTALIVPPLMHLMGLF